MLPGFAFSTVFSFTVYLGMMATATVANQNEFWFECYTDDTGREHYRTNYRICSSQFETITIHLCENFTILSDILSAIITEHDDVSLSITVDRPMVVLGKVAAVERISKLTIYENDRDGGTINLERFVNLKTLNLTGNCARQLGKGIRFSSRSSISSSSSSSSSRSSSSSSRSSSGNGSDNNYSLKLLDLSKSNLTSLPDGYLINHLETLIAIDNYISYDRRFFTSTLPHSTLTGLDLTNNLLGNLSSIALRSNTIRWLNISGNGVNDISARTFAGLSRLEELIMNDNRLTNIDENAFVGNYALRKLSLRNNRLTELDERTFQNLTELRFLDLSKNNLIRLNPGTFQFLDNLSDLILSENKQFSTIVPEPPSSGPLQLLLAAQRLETVRLDRLNLSTFPVTLTRSVRLLDLSANDYTAIRWGDLDGYPLLQTLKLQSNKIELIEYDVLGRLEYLEAVQLDRNRLRRVPRSLAESLKALQLSRNRINEIGEDDFYGLSELEELYLNSNRIVSIAPGSLDPLKKLLVLDLSDNPLVSLNTLSGAPVSLEVLSLSGLRDYLRGNNVEKRTESIEQQQLQSVFPILEMSGIRKLNLSRSVVLTDLLVNDPAILNTMRRVEELDLTETNVTAIPEQLNVLTPHLRLLKVSFDKSRVSCSLPNNDYVINDNRNWRTNHRKIRYPRSKVISISSDYATVEKPGSSLPLDNCEIQEIEHRQSIDHVQRCTATDDDVVESYTERNRINVDYLSSNRTKTSFESTWYRIFGNNPDAKFVASVDNNDVNNNDFDNESTNPRWNDKIKKRTIPVVADKSNNRTGHKRVNDNVSSFGLRNSTSIEDKIRDRTSKTKEAKTFTYSKKLPYQVIDGTNSNTTTNTVNNVTDFCKNGTTDKISLTSANLNNINRTGNNRLNYTFTANAKPRNDSIINKPNASEKTETGCIGSKYTAKFLTNKIGSRNGFDNSSIKSNKSKISLFATNLTDSAGDTDSGSNKPYMKKGKNNGVEFQNDFIAVNEKSNNSNNTLERAGNMNRSEDAGNSLPVHNSAIMRYSDNNSINNTLNIVSKSTTSSKISSENLRTIDRSNLIAKTRPPTVTSSVKTVNKSFSSSINNGAGAINFVIEKRANKRKAFPFTTTEERNQSTTGLGTVDGGAKLNTSVLPAASNGSNTDSDWSILISKESSDSFSDLFVSNETDMAKNKSMSSRSDSVKAIVSFSESKISADEDDQSALISNEATAHPGLIIFGIVLLIVSVFLSPMVISTWLQNYRRKKKKQQQTMRTSISSDMLDDMTVMEIRSVSTITETELW